MDEFRDAVAKITIEGREGHGTGFLVAPGLVATALHVIADRKIEPPTFFPGSIHLKFGQVGTDAVVGNWNQDADCVLLRCLNPERLVNYPTIPLRELEHSGGIFNTRGYPLAQPVDGVTWQGEVRDFMGQLTNFYATRQSAYRPVLQLYCIDAGAGTGAPPNGVSGAPVVVGGAAVGLLRYALMADGRAVAGALYACSAKVIVALDPSNLRLRPPLATVVILTRTQMTRLAALLVAAFKDNLNGLRVTIRYSLGAEAELCVPSAKDLDDFVAKLLPSLVQQGPGMISVLLRAVITACPTDQRLSDFAREISPDPLKPYPLEPLNDDPDVQEAHDEALTNTITRALIELNVLRSNSALQPIILSYQRDFENTRAFSRLAAIA